MERVTVSLLSWAIMVVTVVTVVKRETNQNRVLRVRKFLPPSWVGVEREKSETRTQGTETRKPPKLNKQPVRDS